LCDDFHIPHSEFLEWAPEDRAKAIAYRYEKTERCAMCGTAPWEWEQNKNAYVPVDRHCPGCYRKHMAAEDGKRLPGTTVELTRATPKHLAQEQIMMERRRRLKKE